VAKEEKRRKEALEADAAAEEADREKDLEDVRQQKFPSPAWARWKKIAWPGRNIMEVGMSLKQQMLALPGYLGDFARLTRHAVQPTVGARSGSRDSNLLPLPIPLETVEEEEWRKRNLGQCTPAISDKEDFVL
jgi:hypothetical protein